MKKINSHPHALYLQFYRSKGIAKIPVAKQVPGI